MSLNDIKGQVLSERLSTAEKLRQGVAHIPEHEILLCLQKLHHQYLPKVKQARGPQHEDTRFFEAIRDSLVWSLHVLSRHHDQATRLSNNSLLLEYYQNRCRLLERQLVKYEAIEDMEIKGTLEDYRKVILDKAIQLLQDGDNKPAQRQPC